MKTILSLFIMLSLAQVAIAKPARVFFWFDYPQNKSYDRFYLDATIDGENAGILYISKTTVVNFDKDGKHVIELLDNGQSLHKIEVDGTTDSLFYFKLTISGKYGSRTITAEPIDKLQGGLYVMQQPKYHQTTFGRNDKQRENDIIDKFGSGFLISSEGYVVTNYHVVEGAKTIFISGVNGDYETKHEAEIVSKDVNNDLALLILKDKSFVFAPPPYPLRFQTANTGEDIFILGYPLITTLGNEVKLTTGVISAKSGYGGNASSYQISAPAQPGNSGGPLFDKEGNLIGIVNAKVSNTENITYAIKAVYLQALLSMLPKEPIITTENLIKDKPLSEKVMSISNFVYIIETR